jgi:hypothetical protein
VDLAARVELVLASPKVRVRRAPSADPWPFEAPEPPDLAALYAVSDGLLLEDGTAILPRGELAQTTNWLKQEKSLEDWSDDLIVLGERNDLVLVRDLDREGARAGGGVLEAATDSLSAFKRGSLSLVGYLEARLDPAASQDAAPERRARDAAERRDKEALEAALEGPFYPGSDGELAHAALTLGALLTAAGRAEEAMKAFERSAGARARAAPRGGHSRAEAAAWRACAIAAEQAGDAALAELCSARAKAARAKG